MDFSLGDSALFYPMKFPFRDSALLNLLQVSKLDFLLMRIQVEKTAFFFLAFGTAYLLFSLKRLCFFLGQNERLLVQERSEKDFLFQVPSHSLLLHFSESLLVLEKESCLLWRLDNFQFFRLFGKISGRKSLQTFLLLARLKVGVLFLEFLQIALVGEHVERRLKVHVSDY